MSGSYPLSAAWYNVIWVTVVLIFLTIGEIWSKLGAHRWTKKIRRMISEALIEAEPVGPFVLYFLKFCQFVSFLLLVAIWWIYVYWAYI